jgi:hypothetical protein
MNKLELSGRSAITVGKRQIKLVKVDTDTLPVDTRDWVTIDFWSPRTVDKWPTLRPGVERTRMMLFRKPSGVVRLSLTPEDARMLKAWFAALEL